MKQTSLEQPQLITSLGRLAELDRNWKQPQKVASRAWIKGTHGTARALTQLSILAMAALSTSPVLSPLALQLGSGPYRLQIPALMLLSCLALASFALTSRLRTRLQVIASQPIPAPGAVVGTHQPVRRCV